MIRGMLRAKRSGTCCIKKVKKFRTLETDGELSYNNNNSKRIIKTSLQQLQRAIKIYTRSSLVSRQIITPTPGYY